MAVCLEVLDGGNEGHARVLRQVLGVGGHGGEGEHGPALRVRRKQHGGAGRVACQQREELGAPKPGTQKPFRELKIRPWISAYCGSTGV